MEKRRTSVNRCKGITTLLLSLACCLVFIFCFSGMSGDMPVKALGKNQENIISDTVTGYFLHVPIKGFSFRLRDKDFMKKTWGEFKAFKRIDKTALIIMHFKKVPYTDKTTGEEMSLVIEAPVSINFPGSQTYSNEFIFNNDLDVNIRLSHYNLFNHVVETGKGNYKDVTITLFWDGSGYPAQKMKIDLLDKENIATFNFNNTLDTKELPPGVDDPESPDFDPGAGGGVVPPSGAEDNVSWFEKFFNWLKGIFNFNISYKTFQRICIITVAVIIALIILSFIFKRKK